MTPENSLTILPEILPASARGQKPIYLITHEFYPKHGGIATFTEEIARAAVSLGYDIEVWAQATTAAKERNWPFKLRRLTIKGTHDFWCRAGVAKELFDRRRDLRHATVYMPEPGPQLAMLLLQYIAGCRPKELILTFHGSEILLYAKNPALRMLMRQLLRRATRITTLTEYTRNLLFEHFPEAKEKTILTPGAIRSEMLNARSINGGNAPRDINGHNAASNPTTAPFVYQPLPDLSAGKRIVLTVGRIHPRKGQLHTLRALQSLPQDLRAQTEYWIVGKLSGSQYEEKLRAVAAENPELAVRFLGEIPDRKLSEAYARADIFAMTSINYRKSVEGFGLVYLEASAHGLPVVAHDVGGVGEAVCDGVSGFVVKPVNGNDEIDGQNALLTAAFENLLRDENLRRKMGAAGREIARRTSWADSAKKLFAPMDAHMNDG